MADIQQAGLLISIQDYEDHASKTLRGSSSWDFVQSGANQEQTLRDNQDAFKRWRLMPRMLRGVQERSMTTCALDQEVPAPIGIAPTGRHKFVNEEGECATARAAASEGIVYVMSTMASCTIEEVADAAPNGIKWFQLYIFKDRQVTLDLIRRAEKANFKALVVTVDTPLLGRRLTSERNDKKLKFGDGDALADFVQKNFDDSLTWKDIEWIKEQSSLPIVVKGILRADDAELAIQHGCAAIVVSNHGGRQLDGVPATIDALPGIVRQVRKRCQVYVDGGFRQGTDVLKALALGADMVFIGRPVLWGLAHSGEMGVRNVIQLLRKELDLAMALSGCSCVKDIDRSLLLDFQRGQNGFYYSANL